VANQIKISGEDGVALQVTKPARSAGLVEEDDEGEATFLAKVRVFSFDSLLLVVGLDALSTEHVTELVVSAAQDTKSIYRTMDSTVQIAGNGYQVQLPPAEDAGFHEGDRAPCQAAPGILLISKAGDTSVGRDTSRLAIDLVTIRREQVV
jgi:hypothetical protein